MLAQKPQPLSLKEFMSVSEPRSSLLDIQLPSELLSSLAWRAREACTMVRGAPAAAMLPIIRKEQGGVGRMNLGWLSARRCRDALPADFGVPWTLAFALGTGIFVNAVESRDNGFAELTRATKARRGVGRDSELDLTTSHLAKLHMPLFRKGHAPPRSLWFSHVDAFQRPASLGPLSLHAIQFTPSIWGHGLMWGMHAYTCRNALNTHLGFTEPPRRPEAARQGVDAMAALLNGAWLRS